MRRVTLALVFMVVAVAVVPQSLAPAVADEVGVVTHLDPWSIDGALFSRGAAGVANVDIPGACLAAYQEWEARHLGEHAAAVAALERRYDTRVAENEALIAIGEEPEHDDVPPVTAISRAEYVARYLGMPVATQEWLEQIWEPMEYAPGTDVPCTGKGVLPAPPGGFIGINLGEEPPDPDPCVARGHLPFSPAIWTFYPWWHEDAPTTDAGDPYSGIKSFYDAEGAKVIFTFIPIVIGVQLVIECLAIFPNEEASTHFENQLPAAELTVVPKGLGATGVDIKLWYDFSDATDAVVGPITVGLSHRGTDWTLTAYAWVDAVGWDLDFEGATPVWNESIDFPDNAWVPATAEEYAALGGSRAAPARIYVYEQKDYYTIATGVTWRGYYVVDSIGGLGWGFTEQYDAVTRWTVLPYRVDEIVGRRN